MSFMFRPYPYADPNAVNRICIPSSVRENLSYGIETVAKSISALFENGVKTIGIDAYPGVEYETLINVLRQKLAAKNIEFVDAVCVLLPPAVITEKLKSFLPEDRERDPVLLYGRRYTEGYSGLQDSEKVSALREKIQGADGLIVFGKGTLSSKLRDTYNVRIWINRRRIFMIYLYEHYFNIILISYRQQYIGRLTISASPFAICR